MSEKLTRAVARVFMPLTSGLLIAGCGGGSNAAQTTPAQTAIAPTVTALLASQATAFPTTEATSALPEGLVVWWPEPLAPIDRSEVGAELADQIGEFARFDGGSIEIEFRLKQASDVGGIISTLRTANAVAPGALPDLTLLRREDLLAAAQSGLIYPLDTLALSGSANGYYDIGLELGRVNEQLYGIPYMLDVLCVAYYAPDGDEATLAPEATESATIAIPGWTYDDVLAREQVITFPAQRTNGVNNTFLLQYVAAGGTLPDESELMRLNTDALRSTLQFYERAYEAGLIDSSLLDFTSSADYVSRLENGSITIAIVSSSQYMQLRANRLPLLVAPVPTATGEPMTIANGWMWVMTSPSTDRQALAMRLVDWMMDIERQRRYAEVAYLLPSQQNALTRQDTDLVDTMLMDMLLQNAIPAVPESAGGTVARAMQNALASVLYGERTADQAVEDVLSQTGGS